jgi:hypothetical protein
MTLRGRRFRALLSRLFLLPHIVCCGALCGVCGCANSRHGFVRSASSVRARPPGALAHFPVAASHRAALFLEAAAACLT